MRLTTTEEVNAVRVKGKIVYTEYGTDYCQRFEPGTHLYREMEKLSRYEDICDSPDKLLLCCDARLLETVNAIHTT